MATSTAGRGWRYRAGVGMRILAATLGGYALAAVATAALTLHGPGSRIDAAIAATMLSFLIWTFAVLWAFAARSALWAWLGIATPATLLLAAVPTAEFLS